MVNGIRDRIVLTARPEEDLLNVPRLSTVSQNAIEGFPSPRNNTSLTSGISSLDCTKS